MLVVRRYTEEIMGNCTVDFEADLNAFAKEGYHLHSWKLGISPRGLTEIVAIYISDVEADDAERRVNQ